MSTNALDIILARKRIEVAKAQSITPLETVKARAAEQPKARNFFRAVVNELQRGQTRVIAELKRKSPSAGIIREDFDPVTIARQYADAGAAAISCLTDEEGFGGHLGYIQLIREAVPLPVLRKDFIVDEYQIWESRAAGADAILLIAEVLREAEILDMMILAQSLGMTSLVEVHDVERLLRIRHHIGFPHASYSLLGINNRDLATMKTDITHALRLAELVENRNVLVAESGITSAADLARLRRHGINIVLVGEHLLRQPDPGQALKELLQQPTFPTPPA